MKKPSADTQKTVRLSPVFAASHKKPNFSSLLRLAARFLASAFKLICQTFHVFWEHKAISAPGDITNGAKQFIDKLKTPVSVKMCVTFA